MDLKQKRQAAIDAAQAIIQKSKSTGVPLTKAERDTLAERRAEVESLTKTIDRAEADAKLFAPFEQRLSDSGSAARGLSVKGVAQRLVSDADGSAQGIKALLAAGSQVTETTDIDLTVLKERAPVSFIQSIPVQRDTDENFSYLRQTTRTNNAAPVAVGAVKPTSIYTLTRVEAKLRVVAHLSEAIPEYWLSDNASLGQFVEAELASGLLEAVAVQALNGDGTGENLTGITTASGIQTVAFSTDALTTIRKAITALETVSLVPYLVVMNPLEWEKIELLRENGATGGYLLGSQGQLPIDRAKRQVWGVPVALSTAVPTGAAAPAYVLAEGSVKLFTDGKVRGSWGVQNDDFARNQVRARLETRAQMGILLPMGVVEATITA